MHIIKRGLTRRVREKRIINMLYFISCVVDIACFCCCLHLSFDERPRMLTNYFVKILKNLLRNHQG